MTAFMSGASGGGSGSGSSAGIGIGIGVGVGTVSASASSTDFIFDPSLSMSMSSSMSLPLPPWMTLTTQQTNHNHGQEHDLLERYHSSSTSTSNSNSGSLPPSLHQGSLSHPCVSQSLQLGYAHTNSAHPPSLPQAFSQSPHSSFSQSLSHSQALSQSTYNQAGRATHQSHSQQHQQQQQQQQQPQQHLHYPSPHSQQPSQSHHWSTSSSQSLLGSVGGSDHSSLMNAILNQIASVTQHQSRPSSRTPTPALTQQHHSHQSQSTSQSQSQPPFHSSWPSTLPLSLQSATTSSSFSSSSAPALASASSSSSSPSSSPNSNSHPHSFHFPDFHSQPLSASSSSSSSAHIPLSHLSTINHHANSRSVKLEPVDLTSRHSSTSSATSAASTKRSRKRVKQEYSPPPTATGAGAGTGTSTSLSTSTSASTSLSRVKSPPLACLIPASEDLSVVQSALVAGKRTRRALAKLKPEERQHKKRTKHREADSDRRTKMTKLLDILDRMTGSAAAQARAQASGEPIDVDGDSDDQHQHQPTSSKNNTTEVQPPSRRTRNGILAASIQLLTKLARDVEELKTKASHSDGPPDPSPSHANASPLIYLSPSIMFAANLAMSIVDLDGRCLDVNSKYSSQFAWSRPTIVGAGMCLSSDKIMHLVYGRDHGRVLRIGQEFRRQQQKAIQDRDTSSIHARDVAMMGQTRQEEPTRFITFQERPVEPPQELNADDDIVHPSVRVYPQKLREPHIFPSTIAAIRDLLDGVTDSATCRFRGCDGLGRTVEYEAHLWLTYEDSKPKYFICSFPQNLLAVMDQQS